MYKFLRITLTASLALALFIFLAQIPVAWAADGAPRAQDIGLDTLSDACATDGSWTSFMPKDLGLCASYFIARIAYLFVQFFSWLLWAVAKIFNMVLVVQNGAFYDQPMVNVGWKIARDVANIFYIFFLLIISIATIIRYESYGMKSILWKLIVSALLVNFSLPLAGIVIDFSNALGNTFYVNMSTSPDTEVGNFAKNPDGSKDTTLDISTTLISGFHPSKLLARDKNTPKPPASELADTLLNIIIAEFFAIILIFTVSIMLIAAMILLIIRIVTLWFVLILSPLAFLAWALPQTSGLANRWFSMLFNNAFFYPAFMFTLYISITAIKYNVIAKMVNADNPGLAGAMFSQSQFAAGGASFFTQKIQLILNFVILAMFMGGGLLVAKEMSAYGAGTAMKVSNSLSKSARGYAGRVANAPAARMSEALLSSSVGKTIARIPIARQALRAPAASIQKRAADRAKVADAQAARVKGLSPQAAESLLSTLNTRGQAKVFSDMDEKQKARLVQEMNESRQIAFARNINLTDPSKDYARQVAVASGNIGQAMKILHDLEQPDGAASESTKKEYQDKVDKYVKGLSDADRAKLRADSVNDIYFQRAAIKNGVDTEKLQDSRDIIDPDTRKAFESLTKEINSVTGAVKIMTGLSEPKDVIPPPPEAPKKPDDEATVGEKIVYAEKLAKHDKEMREYNEVNGPAIKKQEEYRKEMSEYMAKYVTDKKMEKVSKDTLKTSPAFQDMMMEEMNGTDIRRMAKDREGAAAIKEAFKGYAERKFKLDIDKDWEKVAVKVATNTEDGGSGNKALGKWMQENMGAQAIIKEGRAASRRDLPTGAPAAPTPSGNSNEARPSGTGTV